MQLFLVYLVKTNAASSGDDRVPQMHMQIQIPFKCVTNQTNAENGDTEFLVAVQTMTRFTK